MTMTQSSLFQFEPGDGPLLLVMPHSGTELPAHAATMMTPAAAEMADASWHLERLYHFARGLGATVLKARYSRYWVDLSPVLETAGALGDEMFIARDSLRGEPLYRGVLDSQTRVGRLKEYWAPFHDCINAELRRLLQLHDQVLLWEAHASASMLPGRYVGRRPVLCMGTDAGATCATGVVQPVVEALAAQRDYSWVVNGRYKGGLITQRYGNPAGGVHAVSLDICQAAYMNEFRPYGYRVDLAQRLLPVLEEMMRAALTAMGQVSAAEIR